MGTFSAIPIYNLYTLEGNTGLQNKTLSRQLILRIIPFTK